MKEQISKIIEESSEQELNLADLEIQDKDIKEIVAKIIDSRPNLINLSFQNNKISDKGAIELTAHLSALPNLALIDLQFNNIGKKGILSLYSLFKTHSKIIIALHGNKIRDTSIIESIKQTALKKY